MIKILQRESKILRSIAKPVILSQIRGTKIQKLLNRMQDALAQEPDGVAIAAPQIGESLRIFLIRKDIVSQKKVEHSVFINPQIIKISSKTQEMHEGCLSARWDYGYVKRATRATIRAYDEKGQVFERGAGGLLAQIFQHEVDHLNGILFVDKATKIQALPPEVIKLT